MVNLQRLVLFLWVREQIGSNQRLYNWYLLFLRETRSTKEQEQTLVVLETGYCGCVKWHRYPQTVASVRWHYEIPNKPVCLVQSEHHHHPIEYNLLSPIHSWKIAHLPFYNNHSFTHKKENLLLSLNVKYNG